jgi:hypothetical protein
VIPLSVLARIVWRRIAMCIIAAMNLVLAAVVLGLGAAFWTHRGAGGSALAMGATSSMHLGAGLAGAVRC